MWEFQMALIAVKWESGGILGGINLDRLDFFSTGCFISKLLCLKN
jgi:hypothetical protein